MATLLCGLPGTARLAGEAGRAPLPPTLALGRLMRAPLIPVPCGCSFPIAPLK